jgi:putative peptidoglycan lipid II flippase
LLVASTVPLFALATIILLGAHVVVRYLAPGLMPDQLELASTLLQILAPVVVLGGLGAVLARILQADERFAIAGAGNLLAVLPALGLLLLPIVRNTRVSVYDVAVGVSLGALLQFAVASVALRGGVALPSVAVLRTVAARMCAIVGPLLLYNCLAYAAVLIERGIASGMGPGTVAKFTYATRIFGLAVILYITPLATVFYPRYAVRHREHPMLASRYLGNWLRLAAILGGLTAALYVGTGYHMVGFVFGRGQFDREAIATTYAVLAIYALGVLPTSVSALLHAACFATGVSWRVTAVAAIDLLLYGPIAIVLARVVGPNGLAAARVVSFWLVLGLVLALTHRRLKLATRPLVTAVAASLGAAGVAGATGILMYRMLPLGDVPPLVGLFTLGPVTMLLYGIILCLLLLLASRANWRNSVLQAYAFINNDFAPSPTSQPARPRANLAPSPDGPG